MLMQWWQWVVLGLILAGLELASPGGFFIIFFGAGAIVVGLLALAGLSDPLWLQWLLFSIVSIVSLLLFRDPLLRRLRANEPGVVVDALTSDIATAIEDIAPGAIGRAELRGAAWSAKNVGATTLRKGERCRVASVEGLMLHIQREGA
jgi:inner membrane protein